MRCNLVDPRILTDQHLIAEKRELRMIYPLLQKKLKNHSVSQILESVPKEFTLGKGHMNFWVNKFYYLQKRYENLIQEMIIRGFKPDLSLKLSSPISHLELYEDWKPSKEDFKLIKERIKEKLLEKITWYRFRGNPIDYDWVSLNYEGEEFF